MAQKQNEMRRASEALSKGRVVEAERLLSRILKKQPANADAHNLRALAFMQRKDSGPALVHAQKAVALKPDDHRYLGNLGSALMVRGKSKEALAHLDRAIEISPDYVHARRNRGVLNTTLRRFGEAVEDLTIVVRHAPNRSDARIALADALIEVKRFDDAVEQLKTAETLDGQQSAAWKYVWGRLMFSTARYPDARKAFAGAMLSNPEKMEHYVALAAASYHCGYLSESERITETCFIKFPTSERSPEKPEGRILVLEPLQETYFSTLPRGPYPYDTTNFVSFMPAERFSFTHAVYQDARTLGAALDLDRYDLVYNNCVVPETFEMNGRTAQQAEIDTAFTVDVINPAKAVAETTRSANFEKFADAEKFIFPRTLRVDHGLDPRETMDLILGTMKLPIIFRPLNTHAGGGAKLIGDARELEVEIAQRPFTVFYAIEYHDCQSADDLFRRYRFACIDGKLTANSLHISKGWNVHGVDREVLGWTERGFDEEENAFYDQPAELLGAEPEEVFSEIIEKTPLDIYGFDFGFRREDGRIVIYEINAAMALSLDIDFEKYPNRKPYGDKFAADVEAYFRSRMRKR